MRHPRLRQRRTFRIAFLAAALTAVACRRDSRRLASTGCAVAWVLGSAVVDVERAEIRERAACGDCPPGQACNPIAHPARCTPSPGTDDVPCGVAARIYRCAEGYRCVDDRCRRMPGVGEACRFTHDYRHLDGEGYCAPGLLCGPDDRCAPGCAQPCGVLSLCSPFEVPPRCVPSTAPPGGRCTRVNRMQRITCPPFYRCVESAGVARCAFLGVDAGAR
jgi:hypothetical protein